MCPDLILLDLMDLIIFYKNTSHETPHYAISSTNYIYNRRNTKNTEHHQNTANWFYIINCHAMSVLLDGTSTVWKFLDHDDNICDLTYVYQQVLTRCVCASIKYVTTTKMTMIRTVITMIMMMMTRHMLFS